MAQFDVHRNTGRLRDTIPFVVIVQSSQFDIRNVRVRLHPLDVVSIPVDALGERVASLADSGDAIVPAMDEVLTRAWH
jgi:toxin CcdB